MNATIYMLCIGIAMIPFRLVGATSSPEELTVRAAYSKFEKGLWAGALKESVSGVVEARRRSGRASLSLGNFEVASLEGAHDLPYESVVTKPSEFVLNTFPGRWTGIGSESLSYVLAEWSIAPYLTEDWSASLATVAKSVQGGSFTRYASYDVSLAFQGRTKTYRATFLFGKDEEGKELILPLDMTIGGSTLLDSLKAPVLLGPLTDRYFIGRADVKAYITALVAEPGCVYEKVSRTCCSPTSLSCGVDEAVLKSSMLPVESKTAGLARRADSISDVCPSYDSWGPFVSEGDVGTNDHTSGNHSAGAVFQGTCSYYHPGSGCCNTICSVSVQAPYVNDTQNVITACHVTGSAQYSANGGGSSASCQAKFAAAIRTCVFCACNVSVAFGGGAQVSFPSDSIWNREWGYNYSCASRP